MTDQCEVFEMTPSWANVDDETLAGHFILAGIDQRFSDQRELARECKSRGLIDAGTQADIEARMKTQAETVGLPGPILAEAD
jgi:hypothetical protein